MRQGVAMVWVVLVVTALSQAAAPPAPARAPAAAPAAGVAPAAGSFEAGQKIEVREGDEWSAATVVKKEGRKFQIKYDSDGTEEWVTAERVRARGGSTPGGAPVTPVPPGAQPAAKPAAKPAAPAMVVNTGDKIQVKWGGSWRDAIVKNKGNGWTLVNYQPGPFHEWVEPWRMRKIGSTADVPNSHPNKSMSASRLEPPPTQPPGPKPVEERSSRDEADAVELPIKDANVANANELLLGTGPAKWALTPDPAPAAKGVMAQPIVLKGSIDIHDRLSPLIMPPDANWAAVMHTNVFERKIGALERINLSGVVASALLQFPVAVAPLDLGENGATLLARSDKFGFGESGRLDVWNVQKAEPQHLQSFMPYGDKTSSSRDITWGRFLSADHVATMNGDGRMIVWDMKNAQAMWAADVSNVVPALSGGRKQIAVVVEKLLVVVDATTGKALASAQLPMKVRSGTLSFRPDGKQIALASNGTLSVWDATTGAHVADAPYDRAADTIDWASEGYVLLGGQTLIDLQQKMTVWSYTGAKATGTYGGRTWYVADQESGRSPRPVLASAVLPNDAVKRAAKAIKPDEIWAAQPGTSVSLDAGGLPGDISAKVTEALRAKLEANGFKVSDGQPIRLVASVEAGKPQEISYRGFRDPAFSEGTKVNATPQTMKVVFMDAEGKPLWQRETTKSPPMMLSLKEGQSHDAAVAEATKPDENFYVNVALPKFVPKAQYKNGLGTSQMGARGVVDAKPQAAAGQ